VPELWTLGGIERMECCYCHKELEATVKICPHCGKSHPFGRSFFTHPVVVISWLCFSAFGFWLTHSFAKLPDWQSVLIVPTVVALLFMVLWRIGD
jgi:uncharacterized protein (DUF983 family)